MESLKNSESYSGKVKYALFLLPILYGIISFYCNYETKFFYTSEPDPAYIYLIDGANIASGNFDIGHFDNPGTTAHLLGGLIIFIAHIFVGNDTIVRDVLTRPEFYLHIYSVVLTLLLLVSIYLSGKLIFKTTKNIAFALLFQLIPICSYFGIHYLLTVRLMPELLIMISLTYYAAFLFSLCYRRNENFVDTSDEKKNLVFFSFITAFLIVTKITCIPFLIIPFFFIKRILPKFLFLILTFLFTAIFTYPIWQQIPLLFSWFQSLATHSGHYGSGQTELFNGSSFIHNIFLLFKEELFFFIVYLGITISVIVGVIQKKWNDNFYKLTFASWIIMSFQVAFAAKHFGFHYLIASQTIAIPAILAASFTFTFFQSKKIGPYSFLFICFIWFSSRTSIIVNTYRAEGEKLKSHLEIAHKYEKLQKILTTGCQGTSFIESALRFGASYGGNFYHSSHYFLRKLYPNSYFYDVQLSDNYVKYWDVVVTPEQLFEKNPLILFYILNWDDVTLDMKTIEKITAGHEEFIQDIRLADYIKETGEKFYIIQIDTSKTNPHYKETENIFCDMETKLEDQSAFISKDTCYEFTAPWQSSTEQYFSGKTSVKTDKKNQYACSSNLPAKAGDSFDISVNCKSSDLPGMIVLSAPDRNVFFKQSIEIYDEYPNGWERINLKATIPKDYPFPEVAFNLYYFGKKTCYFDDLNITIHKK